MIYAMALKAGDQNAMVFKGTTSTTTTRRRLGSWSTRASEWSFGGIELSRLGLTQGELEDKAKTM